MVSGGGLVEGSSSNVGDGERCVEEVETGGRDDRVGKEEDEVD